MITVWGRSSSSNVQKVIWTLDELGVEYDRVDCGREFGGLDTPEYLAMNPNGLIPAVKDGDLVLWESHAICRYLARVYDGDRLFPSDPAAAVHVDKWMDWNMAHLAPSVFSIFLAAREAGDPSVVREARFDGFAATARASMKIMDDALRERNHLCGADFTLADIVCAVSLSRWLFVGHDFGDLGHLRAWYERVGERPASRRNNVASF